MHLASNAPYCLQTFYILRPHKQSVTFESNYWARETKKAQAWSRVLLTRSKKRKAISEHCVHEDNQARVRVGHRAQKWEPVWVMNGILANILSIWNLWEYQENISILRILWSIRYCEPVAKVRPVAKVVPVGDPLQRLETLQENGQASHCKNIANLIWFLEGEMLLGF